MRFFSSSSPSSAVSASEAVRQGLAPDGGLYMPERLPIIDMSRLRNASLAEIAFEVASAFFGDELSESILRSVCDEALDFPAPLVQLDEDTFVLELFHGPTFAFKDFGARFMGHLLPHVLGKHDRLTILTATSGDTGSAVANGFLGVERIRVVILYPQGQISPLQERQMTTLGGNITALEVQGTFDDCQSLVKQAFVDERLRRSVPLASANSINVARLLPQSVYYIAAALSPALDGREPVFVVPSGNLGNVTAGLFANAMGMAARHFIAAHNANDTLTGLFETGVFSPRASLRTVSNSMDVGNPSNLSRLLRLYGSPEKLAERLSAESVSDDDTLSAIKSVLDGSTYLMDPHTAVGHVAWQRRRGSFPGSPGVVLATAHPAKFGDVVERATGRAPEVPPALARALSLPKHSIPMEADLDDLRRFLIELTW